MQFFYVLDAKGNSVPATLEEFAAWKTQTGDDVIGRTKFLIRKKSPRIEYPQEAVYVSTVFLGIDHNLGLHVPHLFETMVFGGPEGINQLMRRCETRAQALRMHEDTCILVRDLATEFGYSVTQV